MLCKGSSGTSLVKVYERNFVYSSWFPMNAVKGTEVSKMLQWERGMLVLGGGFV